jgi:hypothetical protein
MQGLCQDAFLFRLSHLHNQVLGRDESTEQSETNCGEHNPDSRSRFDDDETRSHLMFQTCVLELDTLFLVS